MTEYGQLHQVCIERKIPISKDDQNQLTVLTNLMNALDKIIMEATESTDAKREGIKKNIQEKIPILEKEVVKFFEKITAPKYLDIESDIKEMMDETQEFKEKAGEYQKLADKYQDWLQILDMPINQFEDV